MSDVVTNIQNQEMTPENVQALIEATLNRKSAVDLARTETFKGTKPGLLKALMHGDDGAEASAERVFDFMRAWAENDPYKLGKLSEQNVADAKEAVNDGRITMAEYKVLSPAVEGTNSSGGYTVPVELAADISRNLGQQSMARKHFRQIVMSRKVWDLAGISVKPSVAVYAENSAIANSKPTLDQLALTAKKIAAIYTISNELLEDANVDTYSIILEVFAEQFAIAEDTYAFNNDNTNWNGLLWYGAGAITSGIAANGARAIYRAGSSTGGKTAYPQIGDAAAAKDAWVDLLYMMQGVDSALFAGGKIFIDQNVLVAMMSYKDSSFRFIANQITGLSVQTGLDGQPVMYLFGYEVVAVPSGRMLTYDASAHTDTPFTALCNPQKSYTLMGLRGGFVVDTLREGTLESVSLAANDLQGMRMKERVAFGTGRPETVTVLRTDAS